MSSKIKILNYTDIASFALLDMVDAIYDASIFDGILGVDFSDKAIMEFMYNSINNILTNHKKFGEKCILINTCKPWQNWRKEERGSAIKMYKYQLTDDSVKFVGGEAKLERVLDKIWKELDNKCIKLYNENIDFLDMLHLLTNVLGGSRLVIVPTKFILIRDCNYEYPRKSLDKMPLYLIEKVKCLLVKENLV